MQHQTVNKPPREKDSVRVGGEPQFVLLRALYLGSSRTACHLYGDDVKEGPSSVTDHRTFAVLYESFQYSQKTIGYFYRTMSDKGGGGPGGPKNQRGAVLIGQRRGGVWALSDIVRSNHSFRLGDGPLHGGQYQPGAKMKVEEDRNRRQEADQVLNRPECKLGIDVATSLNRTARSATSRGLRQLTKSSGDHFLSKLFSQKVRLTRYARIAAKLFCIRIRQFNFSLGVTPTFRYSLTP
jgi:hypothetical protein